MRSWAERSRETSLRSSFFVAVEDLASVRVASAAAWEELLEAALSLHTAGARFYPHNHCVFEPESGRRPSASTGFPDRVPGYSRRPSMFYDAVHRNGLDLGDWMTTVLDEYHRFLDSAGIPAPRRVAFRAGGWDHGATEAEVAQYLQALASNDIAFDSSASAGVYGTPSWRVGKPWGQNVFSLDPALVEVAPTWYFDCGEGLTSLRGALALGRLVRQPTLWLGAGGGVLETVLHFDHLFHARRGRAREKFAIREVRAVTSRVDRLFRHLSVLTRALRLDRSVTYEELGLVPAPAAVSAATGPGRFSA